ncbi:unnamed protein product [Urochloa decumbens]|uniref:F-box domain-containing protein n=1 Tax=Urochloa decumbens TaxID=240449 RepID=A0ABC9BKY7_9POAL
MASPFPRCRIKNPTTPAPAPALPVKARHGPHDILHSIFVTLGYREIMHGAELVCKAWRHVAVDEPALWRRIDMGTTCTYPVLPCSERSMVLAAVDRVAGQCVAFTGPIDDDLLLHLVVREYNKVLNKVLNTSLKKLSLLEEVSILQTPCRSFKTWSDDERLLESVCQACPHLNKLRLSGDILCSKTYKTPLMRELRSLQLFDFSLTTKALSAILDTCPLLEYLEVDGTLHGTIDDQLQMKFSTVKNFFLPGLK